MKNDIVTQMAIARKHLEAYQKALDFVPSVLEVVRKFDGKVANKRLETALEAVDRGFQVRRSQYGSVWEIEWYIDDRCVLMEKESFSGDRYRAAFYIKDYSIYFARDIFKNLYGSFTDADGRWIADNICRQIEHNADEWKQYIETFSAELDNVFDIIERRNKLKAEVDAFNDSIDWFMNAYFDLRI